MKKRKLGPVSATERREYLAQLGSDSEYGRPTKQTAEAVWALLERTLPVYLADLMPRGRQIQADAAAALAAKQSLVVALDAALAAADRERGGGGMFTLNRLFDTLALRWSVHFHRARQRGARTAYDMREDTIKAVWRDLLCAGVRIDTLWRIVTGPWSRRRRAQRGAESRWVLGPNPLYSVRRAGGRKRARGWRVSVRQGSAALREFDALVGADPQYRRAPDARRVVFADDPLPPRLARRDVCAETPHNVVTLGERSERVLALLEQARLKFNVDVFRHDFASCAAVVASAQRPRTPEERREYRKLRAFVSAWRGVYQQTEGVALDTAPNTWPEDFAYDPGSGYRWIKSRFFRAVNRRYHSANVWLEHVPKQFRARWFEMPTPAPVLAVRAMEPEDADDVLVGNPFGEYVERDVSASQTQILAVLLGLDDLEQVASATTPKFKTYLAQRLWSLHETDRVLADGYQGADDRRLVEFVKAHWMRSMYGGRLFEIIRDLAKDPTTYGPGWRTSRGLWERAGGGASGVKEAEARAEAFFGALPAWYDEVGTFLRACAHLATIDRDHYRGVVFTDPLDGAEVRWNPPARGVKKIKLGRHAIEAQLPGRLVKGRFNPLPLSATGECCVDRGALGRMVAPCLVHMLDAYFSSLVVEGLHRAGVNDVVAIHDCWFVPGRVQLGPEGPVVDGAKVLTEVVEAAGRKWLEGLGPVYDRLEGYLGNDPTFGVEVRQWRARWEARVAAGRWPRFAIG